MNTEHLMICSHGRDCFYDCSHKKAHVKDLDSLWGCHLKCGHEETAECIEAVDIMDVDELFEDICNIGRT